MDPSPRSQSRFYSKDSQGESKYADFLLQFIALAGSPRLFLRLAVLRRTHYVARVRSYHGGGRGGEAAGLTPTGMRVRPGRLPMRRRPRAWSRICTWPMSLSSSRPRFVGLVAFVLYFNLVQIRCGETCGHGASNTWRDRFPDALTTPPRDAMTPAPARARVVVVGAKRVTDRPTATGRARDRTKVRVQNG